MSTHAPPAPTAAAAPAARDGASEPALHDSQRVALQWLRRAGEVQSVALVSVRSVTDSVQVTVEITETGQRPYRALIAPSGRIHRL